MNDAINHATGWSPDLPDHRDFSFDHPLVDRTYRRIKQRKGDEPPEQVDWREYFLPVDQAACRTCSAAFTAVAMVQYFERRATGRVLTPSRLFVHRNASREWPSTGDCGTSLRSTLKAMKRFGLPPEKLWPYEDGNFEKEPPPYTYCFQGGFRTLRYIRIDHRELSGQQILDHTKSLLLSGGVATIGLPALNSMNNEPDISFPTSFDETEGGYTALLVGYDDTYRIRSDRGAFLIRCSWGAEWGDKGYGWLPYSFVRERLGVDIWTIILRRWLLSGEFDRPAISLDS